MFSIEKQLQAAEGDGVQSFLAIFSEDIDNSRKTFFNFSPEAAMVFDSPDGIGNSICQKMAEVMNLYQNMYVLIVFYISML